MTPTEVCVPTDVMCGVFSAVTNSALDSTAGSTAESFGRVMASFGTFWLYVPTPNLVGGAGSNSDVVSFIQNSLIYFVAIAAILSIMISAIRLIITQRGQNFAKILQGIFTLIIVSAVGLPMLSLLIIAGDQFSVWIVNRSTAGADFGVNLGNALQILLSQPGGAVLVIVLGLIGICVALVQVVLMLIRMVMLVLLAGMLPMAGSFSSTDAGKEYLKKYSGWLIAFLLYKPVAAIIYATAFALISNGVFTYDGDGKGSLDGLGQSVMNVIAGLMMMVIAVVALGALMKFVTPALSAVGGSGAGGALAAGVGAAATGAVSLMAMKNLGGNSGAGSGPSGSRPTPTTTAPTTSAAASTGSAAASGGSAAAGASAGAAGGPVGAGVGLAAGAALQGATAAAQSVKASTDDAVGGGPSGSA